MSTRDDIISIRNGLVTLGDAIANLSVHASADETVVNSNKTINFAGSETTPIYGKGLQWSGFGNTKMLNFQANPDRLWSSNSIDLHRDAHYSIDNTMVLSTEELGPTIKNSNLRSVGVLNGLAVNGDMNIDQFVFWNSGMNRLGVGIEAGNGQLSVASNYVEFRVQPNDIDAEVGTYTTHDLRIQTDSTDRILVKANGDITIGTQGATDKKVKIHGKLAVGINNIRDDADFEVAGPVRMEGKRFSVADDIPTTGVHAKGDIVWNSNPVAGSVIGWVCIVTGTPGSWKSFGNISQ
jgi:hypothetical protein